MLVTQIAEELAALHPNRSATELKELLEKNSTDGKLNEDNVRNVLKELIKASEEKIARVAKERKELGLKEGAEKIEKLVISKSGISSSSKGEELVTQAFNEIKSKAGADQKIEITEEMLNSNEISKKWLTGKTDVLKAEFKKQLDAKDETIKQSVKKANKARLHNAALDFYTRKSANIRLADGKLDEDKVDTIKTLLDTKNWKFGEKGEIIPVDADGNQLEENFNKIGFEDILMSKKMNPFGFGEKAKDKGSFGAGKDKNSTGSKAKKDEGKVDAESLKEFNVSTKEQYTAYMLNPKNTRENRDKLKEAWQEANKTE